MILKQISETVWAGSAPQHSGDFRELVDKRIKTTISLQMLGHFRQVELAQEAGIIPIHLPMSNLLPPRGAKLQTALQMLGDPKYHPIFIHCKKFRDRTPFVVAKYRMFDQMWTRQEALAEYLAKPGPHPWLRWWRWFL